MFQYRLIHFIVDPFTDRRIAIAAVVHRPGRACLVASAPLPNANVFGGVDGLTIVQMVLDELPERTTFARLPDSCGPQVEFGPVRDIPRDVSDVSAWIRCLLAHGAREF